MLLLRSPVQVCKIQVYVLCLFSNLLEPSIESPTVLPLPTFTASHSLHARTWITLWRLSGDSCSYMQPTAHPMPQVCLARTHSLFPPPSRHSRWDKYAHNHKQMHIHVSLCVEHVDSNSCFCLFPARQVPKEVWKMVNHLVLFGKEETSLFFAGPSLDNMQRVVRTQFCQLRT